MPKTYFNPEEKQINDIQWQVIRARKTQKISQGQMAKAIGKSRVTYTERENNISDMRLEEFLVVLHELGLDIEIYERRDK